MATLTFSRKGPWSVLRLVGEIQTYADAATLRAVLFDRLARPDFQLALDVTELDFIGSSGIGVLAQTQQELEKRGETMVLVGASPNIKQLLEIVNLDRIVVFLAYPEDLETLSKTSRPLD
jgi:anti-anti-sigma factor